MSRSAASLVQQYLELTRTPEHADTLAAILKPVSKDEK